MPAVTLQALDDNIACLTLNRPERLNAIDGALIDGVDDALTVLGAGEFRAAILTGAGRGFCAGADLSGTGEPWTKPGPTTPPFKVNYDAQVRLADLFTRLYELPIPVIAAVNGVAVGGGLAFALVCDVRVASEYGRFGSAFIKAGFSSMDMGTSYLLPKIVGAGVARELMLTGRIIDAAEAYRVKLVHEVVAPRGADAGCAEGGALDRREQRLRGLADQDRPQRRAGRAESAPCHRAGEPHADPERIHQQPGRGRDGSSGEAGTSLGLTVRNADAQSFAITFCANISRLRILAFSGSVSAPLT